MNKCTDQVASQGWWKHDPSPPLCKGHCTHPSFTGPSRTSVHSLAWQRWLWGDGWRIQEGQDKWPGGQFSSAVGVLLPGWLNSLHPQGVGAARDQAAGPVHIGDQGQLACPDVAMQRHCKVYESTVPSAVSSGTLKHSCMAMWCVHGANPSSGGSTTGVSGSLQASL